MKHMIDETYKDHEIVFLQQDNGMVTVDIRSDNFDGEMIHGYTDMLTIRDARNKATGYIDGLEATK